MSIYIHCLVALVIVSEWRSRKVRKQSSLEILIYITMKLEKVERHMSLKLLENIPSSVCHVAPLQLPVWYRFCNLFKSFK